MKYQAMWWEDDLETVVHETVVQTIENAAIGRRLATDQVVAHVEGEIWETLTRIYLDKRYLTVEPVED